MFIIPLTLENLRESGLLSSPAHLRYYIEETKSSSFYFHTLKSFGDEFVVMARYKDGIEGAMELCRGELASHSLKPIWGKIRRENQAWVISQQEAWKAKRAQIKDPIRVRG